MLTGELTPKQTLFVDHYLGSFNATDACRKAGYKGNDNTLAVVGCDNLRKPNIQRALSSRTNQVVRKAEKRLINVYEQFTKNLEFVEKLRDASEKWLQHPESDVFSIDPRGDEIDIVYFDYEDKDQSGNAKRKVACLQDVLAKLQGTRYESDAQFIKTVDLREYALKAVDRIETTLDKFAKMGGEYTNNKESPTVSEQFYKWLDKVANDPRVQTMTALELIAEWRAVGPGHQQLKEALVSGEYVLVRKSEVQQLKGVQ